MNASTRLIFDTSPVIYLAKLDALDLLAEAGWAIVPETVADEFLYDAPLHNEVDRIRRAMEAGWLRLRVPTGNLDDPDAERFSGGEADCVRLWREGVGHEIITDDGDVCKGLLRMGIPFRNTPLLAVGWMRDGFLDPNEGKRLLGELRRLGRYSNEIWARVIEEVAQASLK